MAWTIESVRESLEAKQIAARELVSDSYARIDRRNPELNAFLTLCPERAYAQAEKIDRLITEKAPLPPLAGVPVAIKDVISTRGVRSTCGSRILETYTPPYDATAVERLEPAGAILLGKNNLDDVAMGRPEKKSAQWAGTQPDPPRTRPVR